MTQEATNNTPASHPQSTNLTSAANASRTLDDFLGLLGFYRRHWLLMISVTLLTLVAAAIVTVVKGVRYEVSSSLYFKLGTEILPPPSVQKEPVVVTRRTEDVNTEIEILSSSHLIHQVAVEIGEDFFKAPPPQTTFEHIKVALRNGFKAVTNTVQEAMILAKLRRRLSKLEEIELGIQSGLLIEPVRSSDVVRVTLQIGETEAGIIILEKLLDIYLKAHLEAHQNSGLKEFFSAQTEEIRNRMADNTKKLLDFQTSHQLWSPMEQRMVLLDRQKALQVEHAATTGRSGYLETEISTLQTSLDKLPEEIELDREEQRNPAIHDLEDRLAAMKLSMAVTSTSFSEGSRELADATQQIDFLNQRLEEQEPLVLFSKKSGINRNYEELSRQQLLKVAELKGLQNKFLMEEKQIVGLDEQLSALEAAISEFRTLERERKLLEDNYALYAESLEKSRIANVMNLAEISNVSIISPPTAGLLPVWPRMKLVIAAAFITGISLGTAIGFVMEVRKSRRPQPV